MKALILFLLLGLPLQYGCSDLIIREDDSAGAAAGKVTSRVFLGIVTIGLSEVSMSQIKQRETLEAQRQALKENWDSAVGRYTFHDAVQQFGPPSRVLDRSYDFTAVWDKPPGPTVYVPGPTVGYGSFWIGAQVPAGGLQLRFDRKSEILMDWRIW